MYGRAFAGTASTDALNFTPLASAWTGGVCMACLVYRNQLGGGTAHQISIAGVVSGNGNPGMFFQTTDQVGAEFSGVAGVQSTSTAGTGHLLVGATKPTGVSTPRLHCYTFDTHTWFHEAGGSTQSSPATTARTIEELANDGGNALTLPGTIYAYGVWGYNPTDQQVETLIKNRAAWWGFPFQQRLWFPGDVAPGMTVPTSARLGGGQSGVTGTTVGTRKSAVSCR